MERSIRNVKNPNSHRLLYLLVFLVAFAPRVVGLERMPVHIDESIYSLYSGWFYTNTTISGDFSTLQSHPDGSSPLVKYFIGIFQLIGNVEDLVPLPTFDTSSLTPLLLFWSRLPVALIGACSCLIVYRFYGRRRGRMWGLVAATLLSFDPIYLRYSRLALLEVPMMFFFTASILLFYEAFEEVNARKMLLSALLFGLALSSKLIGIFNFLVLLWPLQLIQRHSQRAGSGEWTVRFPPIKRTFLWSTLLFVPVSFLTLFALWPYLWPNPLLRFLQTFVSFGTLLNVVWTLGPQNQLFYLNVILTNLTVPQSVSLCLGILQITYKLFRRRSTRWDSLILLWFIVPFLQLNIMHYKLWRYTLLIIPQISLLSAECLHRMAEEASKRSKNNVWLAPTLVASFLAVHIISVVVFYPGYEYRTPAIPETAPW